MKRFITVLVIMSVLLGIFSACARPDNNFESDSKAESDSKQATDKPIEDNKVDENETQSGVNDESAGLH